MDQINKHELKLIIKRTFNNKEFMKNPLFIEFVQNLFGNEIKKVYFNDITIYDICYDIKFEDKLKLIINNKEYFFAVHKSIKEYEVHINADDKSMPDRIVQTENKGDFIIYFDNVLFYGYVDKLVEESDPPQISYNLIVNYI